MTLDVIFAEFGPGRFNNGDAKLPLDRLEPSLSSFRKHFPEASFTVYTDQDWSIDGVEVRKGDPPFDRKHGRYGNRANDWAQAYGLLSSKAQIAIAIDSDLRIVSDRMRDIIPLTMKFGLAMSVNGRHLVYRDARSDSDGGRVTDESHGSGMCHCTALWSFRTDFQSHRKLLATYCQQMLEDARDRSGARGPLSLWRAQWKTGIFPYTLPSHYCVTGSNLWVPAEDAICLHVGHETVAQKYAELIARNG